MLKKLLIFFVFLLTLVSFRLSLFIGNVQAEGEFSTDFDVTYTLKETGVTEVKNKITITNLFSNMYATSYSVILTGINPKNIKVFDQNNTLYNSKIENSENETKIEIDFPDTVVGKGKSRIFYLSYEDSSFAIRTGEVWEITIPKIPENSSFSSYFLKLIVPEKLGQEAYISPNPRSKISENGNLIYNFNQNDLIKSGIVAGFGQFQVFSFTLHYHLENPLSKNAETEITLPPDTAYQKIYLSNINPRPSSMYIDEDGNWIAKYSLKPRERVDVVANGSVQIFASLRPFPSPNQSILNKNLSENTYWETNDQNIINLAANLKTAEKIYNYVSNTLKYDYERVKPNVERLGARKALSFTNSAICMEFTDLFIAIARAAGIPAREVNGYAYTENPQIQPLSLVNDVLHSWPEYYDFDRGAWIPVDPTWGSTTGGVDYFNKLDLRHFAFVMHGVDSTKPYPAGSYKLGNNPQKDVFVSFGSLPEERNSIVNISAKLEGWLPLISNRLDIEISNPGPVALYNIRPTIYFDNLAQDSDDSIEVLLPFQKYSTYIDIPFSFLGSKTPEIVRVTVNGQDVLVKTNKQQVVLYNLLFISLVGLIVIMTLIFRIRKITLLHIFKNLWSSLKK